MQERLVPPERLDRGNVERWMSHLTDRMRLAAMSRNQAASALAFLFREVFGTDVMKDVERARGARRVTTVLSHREAKRVIVELTGVHRLIAGLLYGAGLRLNEALQIRVEDLDFELAQITVRDERAAGTVTPSCPRECAMPSRPKWSACAPRLRKTASEEQDGRPSRAPSTGRTPKQASASPGSSSSPRPGCPRTRLLAGPADGTSTRAPYRGPSVGPCVAPGSRSRPPATPSATRSRRNSCVTATTSGRSRTSWATRTPA